MKPRQLANGGSDPIHGPAFSVAPKSRRCDETELSVVDRARSVKTPGLGIWIGAAHRLAHFPIVFAGRNPNSAGVRRVMPNTKTCPSANGSRISKFSKAMPPGTGCFDFQYT